MGPAAFAALSRSVVPGTIQGMCVCPAPPSPWSQFGSGLGTEAEGTVSAKGYSSGGSNDANSFAGGRKLPYVTPVLMLLYDNGSVQCFTGPSHLSAAEKERWWNAGMYKATNVSGANPGSGVGAAPCPPAPAAVAVAVPGAAIPASGGSGEVTESAPSSLMSSSASIAPGNARYPSGPIQRDQAGSPPPPPPPPPPPISPPTRTPVTMARSRIPRAVDAGSAASFVMDPNGMFSLSTGASTSPPPSTSSSSSTKAATSSGVGVASRGPGAGESQTGTPSSASSARRSYRSDSGRDEHNKKVSTSSSSQQRRNRRSSRESFRIFDSPEDESPATLESSLAVRRRRVAERVLRTSRVVDDRALASGTHEASEALETSISSRTGRAGGRTSHGAKTAPNAAAAVAAAVAAVAVSSSVAGGNISSGHESTSEDEAFGSLRSQVRRVREVEGAETTQETVYACGNLFVSYFSGPEAVVPVLCCCSLGQVVRKETEARSQAVAQAAAGTPKAMNKSGPFFPVEVSVST